MMSETRFFKRKPNAPKILDKAAALLAAHGGKVTDELRKEFRDWVEKQKKFSSGEKGFKEMDDSGKVYQSVHMGAPEQRLDPKFHTPLIHPKTGKPCPVPDSGWSSIPEFMQNLLQEGRILFGKDETTQPRRIYYLHENTHEPVSTVVGHGRRGKKDLDRLRLAFPYAHSVDLYMTLVESVIGTPNIVLDYFAGSGTTAHAIINLNREGGIQRKFILAEVGEHFNTTLIPRIKKITYSPGWKNGKATDTATPEDVRHGPRLIKYQRIESYEDALANIRFESDGLGFDDDTLHYELNYSRVSNLAAGEGNGQPV